MIACRYIDKQSVTFTAIRDYTTMRDVIDITPQAIKDQYAQMTELPRVQFSGMHREPNAIGPESMMASTLDKMDVFQERYIQAVKFMDWFEPAWNTLADDEQRILKEFYITGNQRSGATARLAVELNFSETHIERLCNKALSYLAFILFGK